MTTGSSPSIDTPLPDIRISSSTTTNSTGDNETLTYNTAVSREISITSTIKTSSGSQKASWTQSLSYSNFNSLTDQGFVQLTIQNTTGSDLSSSGYANTYEYPIDVNSSFSIDDIGEVGINGTLTRGLDYNVYGPSVSALNFCYMLHLNPKPYSGGKVFIMPSIVASNPDALPQTSHTDTEMCRYSPQAFKPSTSRPQASSVQKAP